MKAQLLIEGIMHTILLFTMLIIHHVSAISRLQVVVGMFLRFSVLPLASEQNAIKPTTAI
jgi:2-iminoacetate synthase ThiH